jgi:hypothetical protein
MVHTSDGRPFRKPRPVVDLAAAVDPVERQPLFDLRPALANPQLP